MSPEPSGLLGALPGLVPVYPRVACSSPRLDSARRAHMAWEPGEGPLEWESLLLSFHFCNQFANSDDGGLGTFSEYSQVCSHEAERG